MPGEPGVDGTPLLPLRHPTPYPLGPLADLSLLMTLALLAASLPAVSLADRLRGGYAAQSVALVAALAGLGGAVAAWGLGALTLGPLLTLLAVAVVAASLLAEWNGVRHRAPLYYTLLLALAAVLAFLFSTGDLVGFYVGFELVLVPTAAVIGIWGSGGAHLRAAFLFFLYTLAGSLPMLGSLALLWGLEPGPLLTGVALGELAGGLQLHLLAGFALALAVKTPLVPFHTWLFRAHAQAPVGGSMALAGAVLKLGAWGVALVCLGPLATGWAALLPLAATLAAVSLLYSSLATLRAVDLKAAVALSSVAHMGTSLLGLAYAEGGAWEGGMLLQLAHGLVSPALFLLVGGVLYERFGTLLLPYYRGLAGTLPVAVVLLFAAAFANCGTPPTLNWLAELEVVAGVLERSPAAAALAALGVVAGAAYSLWLASRVGLGTPSPHLRPLPDLDRRQAALAFALVGGALAGGPAAGALMGSLGV